MARPTTRRRVHDAVFALAAEAPVGSLTMEGVAARARISKQTLYRTWPSVAAILFDALRARSEDAHGAVEVPDTGDIAADTHAMVAGMVSELTDRILEPLLRTVTAHIQVDEPLAAQYRDALLFPQMAAISERMRRADLPDPEEMAELLVGPILHRWLLRSHPFSPEWIARHVARTLRAGCR